MRLLSLRPTNDADVREPESHEFLAGSAMGEPQSHETAGVEAQSHERAWCAARVPRDRSETEPESHKLLKGTGASSPATYEIPIVLDHGEVHQRAERATEKVVEVEAHGMGGALGLDAGAQAADGLRAVLLEVSLGDQLAIDSLDDLPGVVDGAGQRRGQLLALVASPGRQHHQGVAGGEQLMQGAVAVALVAQHRQPGLVAEQLLGQRAIGVVGGGQGEIEDEAAPADAQVQLEAVDGLLLGGHPPVVGLAVPAVVVARVGEADGGHRHASDGARSAPSAASTCQSRSMMVPRSRFVTSASRRRRRL